jgi:hypothetical protein
VESDMRSRVHFYELSSGLREGAMVRVEGGAMTLKGRQERASFAKGLDPAETPPGDRLDGYFAATH